MRTIWFVLLALSALGILSSFATLRCEAATYQSDGSASSVQVLQRTAHDGDTITIPSGTFTWSRPVTISKAIKLQGQGSGRIIGNTKSQSTIGTGSKTFTTTQSISGITAGQTLRIAKMPTFQSAARENYMEGTVTSYSGTTLVMNIGSTGGSGTYKFWWIATKPATTIINNYDNGASNNNAATAMLDLNLNPNGSVKVSGIQFVNGPSGNSGTIGIHATSYIIPKALIYDCWFEMGAGNKSCSIFAGSNEGLVWNCSFDDTFSRGSSALQFKAENAVVQPSWSSNSTMGKDDTDGATNFYVEDCDFHAYLAAADFDDNSRVVWRYNRLDNSGMSSHGADTSPTGLRHVEIYNNELIFDNFGDCNGAITLPLEWCFWMRGGTGVITDNVLPRISSCAWGNKVNIAFSVLNTERNSGPFCCWTNYPAPHQVGQGYGPGAVFHEFTSACGPYSGEDHGYYIHAEPVHIWNNSGAGGNEVSLNAESGDPCKTNQALTKYIHAGRDYKLEPKPGYAKYTYPHPLRSSLPPSVPIAHAGLRTPPGSTHKIEYRKNAKLLGQKKKRTQGKVGEGSAESSAEPAE